jgi:hypothetical protein
MTREETAGIGIALLGHAALVALLIVSLRHAPPPLPKPAALEVSISDDVGLTSQAPNPSKEAPAEKKADELGPVTPDNPPPVPQPAPETATRPTPPKAAPSPTPLPIKRPELPKPTAAPASASAANSKPVRPTGRLSGIINGLSDSPTQSQSTATPAAEIGPQVRSALAAEIIRQIKPHWVVPTGADVDKLKTTVEVQLNPDGSISGQPRVTQTGITDTNRAQAQLHRERAVRAVQLAAPFKLPPEFYAAWKTIAPTLYEGL